MSKPAAARPRSLLVALARFLPALGVFALALPFAHPLILVALLAGNALMLTAICAGIGFDMDARFARSVARRGLAGLVLLTLYTLFVAALLAAPAWWLLHEPSLTAALVLSAAGLLAVLALWRLWPAFALPFVWDDAYPEDAGGSWLLAALRRSLAFARHLTGEHELFFSHGLPAALAAFAACAGALALAALAPTLAEETRVALLAGYALTVVPLAQLVIATRCSHALLADARRHRVRARREGAAAEAAADGPPASLPAGIGPLELGATLLAAARSGQVELALAALHRGADPGTLPLAGERDQRSVLIHAVLLPDLRLLRGLIAKGVDVNRVHGGMSALVAATRGSYQGRPDAVMTLLANGADARVADAEGNTALHHAALCADPVVAALLLDAGALVDAVNREGQTPLGVACANANWVLAEFLLDRGARSEVEHAQPALLLAAAASDDDDRGVRLLLKRKARPDTRGPLDRTALMAAALAGHVHVAEALLAGGAGVDLADRHGTTALMEAARAGAMPVVNALAKRKADPDRVDVTGRSALIIACTSRLASEDTVRALLALGADRGIVGGDGKRALDHAVASGRWHIVALLDPAYPLPSSLDAAAPVEAANAAHLVDALRFGHWNIAETFRSGISHWPPTELAGIHLALAEEGLQPARDWLCNAGLALDAQLADGRSLFEALLGLLPSSAQALAGLIARGTPVGGVAVVARVLAAVPANGGDELRRLAAELVERGADVGGRMAGDTHAIHLAAALGETGLVATLLARGTDANLRDARGRMPLHFAMKARGTAAVDVTRALIRHGADPDRAAANGETPLGLALARGERELVNWLDWPRWRLPQRALLGADLPAAAASGDVEAVDKLLALGLHVDAVDAQGATALIRAAGSGYAALVARLLDAGADPALAAHSGATCLSAAIAARREAVVRTLLERGVAPDQRLPGGGTALMMAAAFGLPHVIEALLAHGADVNAHDERGNTPLLAAAQAAFDSRDSNTWMRVFDVLLRAGADHARANPAGQTAVLLLLGARAEPGAPCDAQHLGQLVRVLIAAGAGLGVSDQRGVSALHACAMHGLLGVARLLKAHAAPLDLVDGFGRSPGEVAALLGYVDVAAELGVVRQPVPSARQTLRRRVTD